MYRIFLIFTFCLFTLVFNVKGQIHPDATGYYNDAMQYSRTTFGGTARYMGLAGATSSLGGDLGSVHVNPAGLGFHRRSEASGSMGFNFAGTRTNFQNNVLYDGRTTFNIPNFGVVFAEVKDDIEPGIWRGGAFGVSFTRINNFNNQYSYSGTNTQSSITDYFENLVGGTSIYNYAFPSQTFYDLVANSNVFEFYGDDLIGAPVNRGLPVLQDGTVYERGGQNQWDFSYGGNFNDRVYLGASVGIARIRHIRENYHRETVQYDDSTQSRMDLLSLDLFDYIETRGSGINLKIGTIIRPADWIRMGLTLQTPTYYSINDQFYSYLRTTYLFSELDTEEETPMSSYRYNLTTPMRLKGGVSIFAGKNGFVSGDVEWVDYSTASLRDPNSPQNLSGDNRTIGMLYRSALNLSVGGEYRFDIYRARAGFATLGDPLHNFDNVNRTVYNFTLGGGIRLPDYYFDVAVVHSRSRGVYSPYTLPDNMHPVAFIRNGNTNVVLTGGIFF